MIFYVLQLNQWGDKKSIHAILQFNLNTLEVKGRNYKL